MSTNLRIACVMVGLPARGKTYIAQKVCRYLTWLGIKTESFSVANYRRKLVGSGQPASFFDIHNSTGLKQRREAATAALEAMLSWFDREKGTVAIFDATNSTKETRAWLNEQLTRNNIQPLFIESICEVEDMIGANMLDVQTHSPDYKNMDPIKASKDYETRIKNYVGSYETITEDNYSYVKLVNSGSQYIINLVQDYLESRIVYYLINLQTRPKRIWFSRHGESQFNIQDRIGGDAELSERGRQYAKELPDLVARNIGDRPLVVWTSTLKRTIQTAAGLPYPKKQWKALDELDTGVCDGMTYDEIAEKYPEDYARRDEDKFNYRYRGGESYRDVVLRLEPVIMELEQHENILIIAHQATIRCMYAFFMNISHEKLPYARIPLHTIIELKTNAYSCEEKQYKVGVEAVDTYRPKPSVPLIKKLKEQGEAVRRNEGASGEIADASEPILPLSPVLPANKKPSVSRIQKSAPIKPDLMSA
ncbi:6-phosphofructo-2-kinase-domain-containing protein [Phycomyces blakesleeanus]|uniref:6-phosphofructo-2-kinase-domain-containing protein n=1 Tax=Phycomyces blakesleeanus TaxID=4837 RepID=A0ABR3BD93_PHYBL